MARMRASQRSGPGWLLVFVGLVVAGVAGVKYYGVSLDKLLGQFQKPRAGEPGAPLPEGAASPKIVVYYSHTSENYHPAESHAKGEGQVVQVGEELVKSLQEKGVRTLHVTEVHDVPSFEDAFNRSAATLNEVLAANDDVAAVLDIHRDALPPDTADGYATAQVNGRPVARILLVVGDLGNPLAEQNLAFAELLRDRMNTLYPEVMRGVRVLHGDYNGQLHPNSLQVFIGDYRDNTLEEAQEAARLLAEALAGLLMEGLIQPATAATAPESSEGQVEYP